MVFVLSPTDLNLLVTGAVTAMQPIAKGKNLYLVEETMNGSQPGHGSSGPIGQE